MATQSQNLPTHLETSSSSRRSRQPKTRRPIRRPQRPVLVGFTINLETFADTTFSIPLCVDRASPENAPRGESNTTFAFESLKGAPDYYPIFPPDYTASDTREESEYYLYFFPTRRLADGEAYDKQKFTLDPTERDRTDLLRFKSWIEKKGGQFDTSRATFMAVPNSESAPGPNGFGYIVL